MARDLIDACGGEESSAVEQLSGAQQEQSPTLAADVRERTARRVRSLSPRSAPDRHPDGRYDAVRVRV